MLNIDKKYENEERLENISQIIEFCKEIFRSKNNSSESPFALKELLQNEKAKYLDLCKRYQGELVKRRKLQNTMQELKGNIRIMCRVRPLLQSEVKKKCHNDWMQIPGDCTITASNKENGKISSYEFDRVFNHKEGQDLVFDEVQPMITSAMDGYNVAILAYGQTGSGKTYTMEGNSDNEGIIIRALHEVFELIKERSGTYKYEIDMSLIEIYNEKVRNLLDKKIGTLELMENAKGKLEVVGLTPRKVSNASESIKLFRIGKKNRVTGVTSANEYSSRSHSVLTLYIKGINELKQKFKARLDLVDLAGSERLYKSEAEGERMKEGTNINLSLTTLGKVLNSLAARSSHIPYRDSKLTHLLKSSIGGDSKTLIIVQVSPNPVDMQESISTLLFGAKVCGIEKGKLKKNISKKC